MLDSPAEVVRQLSAQGHGPQEKNLTGLCILLAEDGIDNQNLISYLLRKAGAHVEVADNGKIAVQKASDQPFDVILMDMQMPEMDGYEATQVLRERGFTGPILALTAHAMSNDRQKCLQAGCDDYMAKPVNPAKLVQTIARYGGKEMSTDQITTGPTQKTSTGATQPIESEFADDPDFTRIIDQFVAGLTDKVESIQQALANADFEMLQRLAHQLKGAGGSYGYPALTDPAKALEEAAKARDHEAAGLAFTPLAKLCQAIIAARKAETPSDGG